MSKAMQGSEGLLTFFRQPEKMLEVLNTTPDLSSYNVVHLVSTYVPGI